MGFEPNSRPLKGRIADVIRSRIIVGALDLGARLSDKDLATELQTSRTPVREALLQLQSEGLVVVRPRSGTFVFDLSVEDLRQICELRGLFESGAVRMGMAHGSDRMVTALATRVAEAAIALDAGDFAACEALDTAFHETLIELSGNRYLIESYRTISDKVRALRSRLPQMRERIANAIAQHRRIVDLVAVGRVDAAADELAQHVRNVHGQLTAAAALSAVTA
jgi:DNA-binding GntR family transcriptional regulator